MPPQIFLSPWMPLSLGLSRRVERTYGKRCHHQFLWLQVSAGGAVHKQDHRDPEHTHTHTHTMTYKMTYKIQDYNQAVYED